MPKSKQDFGKLISVPELKGGTARMGRKSRAVPSRLAEKLLAIRLYLDLTQAELLQKIHPDKDISLAGSIIGEFERGRRSPSLIETLSYARLVKVPMEQIVDDNLDLPPEIMAALTKLQKEDGTKTSYRIR